MQRHITARINDLLASKDNKVILLVGQRQVGKTFEIKRVQGANFNSIYFDFEEIGARNIFKPDLATLENILGSPEKQSANKQKLLLLDEIQHLQKSGSILKLIHDHFQNIKVIATGSASFLMLKNIGDSLYGRNIQLDMFPLTFREINQDLNADFNLGKYNKLVNKGKIEASINDFLLYGSMPGVFLTEGREAKIELLKNYINSFLYKDIFELEGIRMPEVFKRLLHMIALQIGSEVNPNELALKLEINRKTVVEYLGLCEKFKIIHILKAFSGNPRKEVTRNFKIYFTDLGIRNALIDNFVLPENRTDIGAMFENLVVNTLSWDMQYFGNPYKLFFWRSKNMAEVDLVLLNNLTGKLVPMEIKYGHAEKPSIAFIKLYEDKIESQHSVNKENFWKYT
ncbi:MAG: ATP-binding protein [Candidatus Gracilibacteria bacterium]|jgi:hypothetical protein